MSIVKSYSRSNNTYYAYEQNMKWNPDTKRPEGTRKLIGKFDPVTGEIVPTGKRGRKKKEDSDSTTLEPGDSRLMKQNQHYQEEARQLREQLSQLKEENSKLKKQISSYEKTLDQIAGLARKKI